MLIVRFGFESFWGVSFYQIGTTLYFLKIRTKEWKLKPFKVHFVWIFKSFP